MSKMWDICCPSHLSVSFSPTAGGERVQLQPFNLTLDMSYNGPNAAGHSAFITPIIV